MQRGSNFLHVISPPQVTRLGIHVTQSMVITALNRTDPSIMTL